jgi:hypothetical protein
MSLPGLFPYLTVPLEDEALYSYLARLLSLNGVRQSTRLVASMFGPGKKSFRPELPVGLSALLESWPETSPYGTVEDLVERTTQYPYHRSFMSREQWIATLEHAASSPHARTGKSLGLVAHGFGVNTFLRSCCECNRESWLRFGTVYWHRAHLLPGVTVCWRHHEQLSVHTKWTLASPQLLFAPPLDVPSKDPPVRATSWTIQFAKTSAEALYAKEAGPSSASRSAIYLTRLKEFGLMHGDHVLLRELSAQILEYNDRFNEWPIGARMRSTVNGVLPWLRGPLSGTDRVSPPLIHIVLINFLFGSLAAFRTAEPSVSNLNADPRRPPSQSCSRGRSAALVDAPMQTLESGVDVRRARPSPARRLAPRQRGPHRLQISARSPSATRTPAGD